MEKKHSSDKSDLSASRSNVTPRSLKSVKGGKLRQDLGVRAHEAIL